MPKQEERRIAKAKAKKNINKKYLLIGKWIRRDVYANDAIQMSIIVAMNR